MNNDGKDTIRFGNPSTRSEKKFPNTIFLTFITKDFLYSLFIKYKFQKSEEEKT